MTQNSYLAIEASLYCAALVHMLYHKNMPSQEKVQNKRSIQGMWQNVLGSRMCGSKCCFCLLCSWHPLTLLNAARRLQLTAKVCLPLPTMDTLALLPYVFFHPGFKALRYRLFTPRKIRSWLLTPLKCGFIHDRVFQLICATAAQW